MYERGTVHAVEGHVARVRLRPARPEVCAQCRACDPSGSGVCVLTVPVADLVPGDAVTVAVPLPGPWRAMGLVLACPLAAMVGGAVLGAEWPALQQWLGLEADATALATGLTLAIVALGVAAVVDRVFRRRHRPHVLTVHHGDPAATALSGTGASVTLRHGMPAKPGADSDGAL